MAESYGTSPPKYGRIARLRGFLPLNEEPNPMATHGSGTLTNLIRSRSAASLHTLTRRPGSSAGRDTTDDEDGARDTPQRRSFDAGDTWQAASRRASVLYDPRMRSQRLIGNCNPRYRWHQYWKTEEELKQMKKPMYVASIASPCCSADHLILCRRKYYERNNSLIQQYLYIDRLLDSSIPHSLLNEYNQTSDNIEVPPTISEEPPTPVTPGSDSGERNGGPSTFKKVKRTPKDLYKVPTEDTPLVHEDDDDWKGPRPEIPGMEDDSVESGDKIVQVAIYVNLVANTILLIAKIAIMLLTNSLSVLASLVDAALDFLSTGIVWTTTRLIARQDSYMYPVGRRRLEPIGVLVFSVIMVTSFFQVALECFYRLTSGDRTILELGLPAIVIMASTVFIKALCWLWCRLIKNSSVQALAQDAMTDVIFNIFSIIFPLGMCFTPPEKQCVLTLA
jgi:Cation efflux family